MGYLQVWSIDMYHALGLHWEFEWQMAVEVCSPTKAAWYLGFSGSLVIRDVADAGSFSVNTTLRCFLTTYWLNHFISLACLQGIERFPESEKYL